MSMHSQMPAASLAKPHNLLADTVETVQGDPNRVRKWVKLTRQVIDEVFQ